jgi:hypothetical protein
MQGALKQAFGAFNTCFSDFTHGYTNHNNVSVYNFINLPKFATSSSYYHDRVLCPKIFQTNEYILCFLENKNLP